MSNKLIKRYKYIDSGVEQVIGKDKILKQGDYRSADYTQFEGSAEKKPKEDDSATPDNDQQSIGPQEPVTVDTTPETGESPEVSSSVQPVEKSPDINSIIEEEKKAIEDELKKTYESRLNSEKQISYNEGVHQGKKAGLAENAAEVERLKQVVENMQKEFQEAASKFFDEVEKLTMDMSVYLAKKIIGDAVSAVPDIIRTNVDKCVKLLAGSGTVQIKINPNDYETIKSYIPELEHQSEGKFTFVLEPENKVERGGCIVEFEGSSIDGRIQTQIEKIQKQMEMIT